MDSSLLPPGQQWVAAGKWPSIGERSPRRDDAPWRVDVAGLVARPCSFSLHELRAMPQVEQSVDIHCVTRWSRAGVRFGGVSLAHLFERAQPAIEARYVAFVARSDRAHCTSLVLADALQLETLIALSVDGAPLGQDHGGPVRVVVPGRYFYKSLKWLERIELLVEDRLGYWEATAGYHNTADPRLEQRYMAGGISQSEARAILAAGDISQRELRRLDARRHDLTGLVAREALLRDADFRDCPLQRANFDGANLTNAHLQGADLRDATLRHTDLEGANLAGADLRGACLLEARLLAASFCEPTDSGGNQHGALVDDRTQFSMESFDELTLEQQDYLREALAKAKTKL